MRNNLLLICLMFASALFSQQFDIAKFGAKPGDGIDDYSDAAQDR